MQWERWGCPGVTLHLFLHIIYERIKNLKKKSRLLFANPFFLILFTLSLVWKVSLLYFFLFFACLKLCFPPFHLLSVDYLLDKLYRCPPPLSSKNHSLSTFLKTCVKCCCFSLHIFLVTFLHAKYSFSHPFSFWEFLLCLPLLNHISSSQELLLNEQRDK